MISSKRSRRKNPPWYTPQMNGGIELGAPMWCNKFVSLVCNLGSQQIKIDCDRHRDTSTFVDIKGYGL
jgi:hypothetical protein